MINENNVFVIRVNREKFFLDEEESTQKLSQNDQMLMQEIYERYTTDYWGCMLSLGFLKPANYFTPSFSYLVDIAKHFVEELLCIPQLDELKEDVQIVVDESTLGFLVQRKPYFIGDEFVDEAFLKQFFAQLNMQYGKELQASKLLASEYLKSKEAKAPVGRIFFHLVENPQGDDPFAFLATYSRIVEHNKITHIPLRNALKEYQDEPSKLVSLLSTVDKTRKQSSLINSLSMSGEIMRPLKLNAQEAYTFLKEIPIYEECGIVCRVPKWFKQKVSRVKISTSVGESATPLLGMDTLLDFHVRFSVQGEELSYEELQELMKENEGLALIKGKWVEINKEDLAKVLQSYANIQQELADGLTLKQALRLQLEQDNQEEEQFLSISNGSWLQEVLHKLKQPSLQGQNKVQVEATLRPYQKAGVEWLSNMYQYKLGACLADDMGLGKTLQIISLLTMYKQKQSLLIVPASLLGNWMEELERFAPQLNYFIMHSSFQKASEFEKECNEKYDLVITTYKMAGKYEWMKEKVWDLLILDEAQAIKNPNTAQSKTIKSLQAHERIALTGTPVENKLLDLWSILDFLNPGLLGSIKEFKHFTKNLKEHPEGYAKLKDITSHFLLRRLKTDPTIISDLPEKIEMKTYANLSKKQIALYQDLVNQLQQSLETSEGIQRKGLVLASLSKFKQICNHPDEYLGKGEYDAKESGKFLRLKELCEEIYAKREQVLIFTQFKEMVQPIAKYLETVFHHSGVTLDGGTSIKKRKEVVAQFQSDDYVPFMVLSLKAGGVGLNLTNANHVIHFDRWWNPAVENQASDRAFRIGQKKNVIVHKFICEGTLEEKIDQIIEDKKQLAIDVIGTSSESWITEMKDQELLDMLRLERGA